MPPTAPTRTPNPLRRTLAALAAVLAVLGTAPAAAATTPPGPRCGDHLTQDVTLTHDLVCEHGALSLGPGVTLDLGGRTITSPGEGTTGFAIRVPWDGSATVRNGALVGWEQAIVRDRGPEHPPLPHNGVLLVDRVRVERTMIGVDAHTGHLRVTRSTFVDVDAGVYCSTTCDVAGSTFVRGTDGVLIDSAASSVVDSTFRGLDGVAVRSGPAAPERFTDRSANRVERNVITGTGVGILLDLTAAVVRYNVLRGNRTGMEVADVWWPDPTPAPDRSITRNLLVDEANPLVRRGRLTEYRHNTFVALVPDARPRAVRDQDDNLHLTLPACPTTSCGLQP